MKPPNIKYSQWIKYNIIFLIEHFTNADFFKNPNSKKNKLTTEIYNDFINLNLKFSAETNEIFNEVVIQNLNEHKLYKGLAKSWPAYKKWSFDYFKEKYGTKDVIINNNKGIVDPKAPQKSETIELKKYIEELENGTLKYLKLSSLAQKEKSLQLDLDLTWLKKFKKIFSFGETFYMFIGGKNTKTPMHNEFPTTIYIQIHGIKKWVIYRPEDRIFLDAITERRPYFFSKHIPDTENSENKIARFATKYEIILEPGDVLVVPPFYWHYVENITDSIGVAYKFADIITSYKSSKLLTFLFFLSTKPSIFYSFFASRFKKEDQILNTD